MCHKKYLNGNEYEIYNKNGLVVQTKYNNKKQTTNIISQCVLTDEKTGLRFRGKVEINENSNGQTSKKLYKDDQLEFSKSGDKVLVDKLSNLSLRTEMLIGWKAAKNANGEKRIIKLGICPEAKIIKPIDEEYYLNHQKERTNEAIVMDIQLPDEQDEISVVPHETSAYSFVYSPDNRFEYPIGQLVKPDEFDENPDFGCTKGIHFFRDRTTLFNTYIKD
jgi:hypothetical protein